MQSILRTMISRKRECDHLANSMNFEGVLLSRIADTTANTTTNSEFIRFLTSRRDSAFRMRRSCICICIIDACKVIRTRCTCVYIFTYVCKCTRYNMHYRSRATPRQFSTSLRFEVLNRNCRAGASPL